MGKRMVIVLGLALGVAGCASAPKSSGFLGASAPLHAGRHFAQEYVAPGVEWSAYRKVRVNPVHLEFFKKPEAFSRDDLERLAGRLHEALESALAARYTLLSLGNSWGQDT